MPSHSKQCQQQELLAFIDAYHAAMAAADIAALHHMLQSSFVLVHLTGYRQPGAEWLEVVRTRAFDYHHIRVGHQQLQMSPADVDGDVRITGAGMFDATINGVHALWPLRFTLVIATRESGWGLCEAAYDLR